MKNETKKAFEYTRVLSEIGFSEKESIIYELLLQHGQIGVADLLKMTSLKRGDLYYVLYALRDKGVIEQTIKRGKIQFRPLDPYKLLDHADKQKQEFLQSYASIQTLVPKMFEHYNLLYNRPSIFTKAGVEGMKEMHALIERSGRKELYLFRSVFDNVAEGYEEAIQQHRRKRAQKGIHVKALTPATEIAYQHFFTADKEMLFERRLIKTEKFSIPAEISVWGNNIAIVSYRQDMITTVIENKDIAQTFKIIFNMLWEDAKSDHDRIVRQWTKRRENEKTPQV